MLGTGGMLFQLPVDRSLRSFPAGQTVHIEQGVEIKRPSQILVRAKRQGGKIVNVRVGGNAVEIMEGDRSCGKTGQAWADR